MTQNPPNVLTVDMMVAGVCQISKEGEHVNGLLSAIVNAFLEADVEKVAVATENAAQCSVWLSEDTREWVLMFNKKWELSGIYFFHRTAPAFHFQYQISDSAEGDEDQVYDLNAAEIALVRGHLELLFESVRERFPFLDETFNEYKKAAARAGYC